MKIRYNIFIPFGTYYAMSFFGVIYARRSHKPLSKVDINHEKIHKAQALELKKESEKGNLRAYIRFYAAYINQIRRYGYDNSPYEKEAYEHEGNLNYLETRPLHAWRQYE